jgi:hypothetical protein
MTAVPTPSQLAQLDDAELEELAHDWRARAARGESGAFGVAHVLEVERRGRIRASQMITLRAPLVPNTRRRWWKFWESDPGDDPMSPT